MIGLVFVVIVRSAVLILVAGSISSVTSQDVIDSTIPDLLDAIQEELDALTDHTDDSISAVLSQEIIDSTIPLLLGVTDDQLGDNTDVTDDAIPAVTSQDIIDPSTPPLSDVSDNEVDVATGDVDVVPSNQNIVDYPIPELSAVTDNEDVVAENTDDSILAVTVQDIIESSPAVLPDITESEPAVLPDITESEPIIVIEPTCSCAYYGNGKWCPALTPYPVSIEFGYEIQPFYATFAPLSAAVIGIDNICYTFLPFPDGSGAYLQYISTVYTNGYNTIATSIATQRELGTTLYCSSQCSYVDIMFYNIFEDEVSCFTNINYRCFLCGECDRPALGVLPVFGMSYKRNPISAQCINLVNQVVFNNGLPTQNYYRFPMRLPSRCVLAYKGQASPSYYPFQTTTVLNGFPRTNC